MIFKNTWQKVLSGQKTTIRRLVQLGEWFCIDHAGIEDGQQIVYCWHENTGLRRVYLLGKAYAVQPGRGKPPVGRIRITDIRRKCEDVRDISHEDAVAEGFTSPAEFLQAWTEQHDKDLVLYRDYLKDDGGEYLRCEDGEVLLSQGWYLRVWGVPDGQKRKRIIDKRNDLSDADVIDYLRTRPAERYQAWVLTFELVGSEE